MKKLLAAAIALAALNLTGCVQLNSHTEIAGDGSGTMAMTVSMTETVKQAMDEMAALETDQSGDMKFPAFDDIDRATLEKAGKDYGVKVTEFKKEVVDGRETLEIALAFDDLRGFSYVMGHILGDGNDEGGLGIFDAGDGNLVLRETEYDFPEVEDESDDAEETAPANPAEMDPEKMAKQMEIMGTLMGAIAELDVQMQITVPGDIVSSSAPTTEGRTSTWSINASNMMSPDADMSPEIVFSGKGLKIKPLED